MICDRLRTHDLTVKHKAPLFILRSSSRGRSPVGVTDLVRYRAELPATNTDASMAAVSTAGQSERRTERRMPQGRVRAAAAPVGRWRRAVTATANGSQITHRTSISSRRQLPAPLHRPEPGAIQCTLRSSATYSHRRPASSATIPESGSECPTIYCPDLIVI